MASDMDHEDRCDDEQQLSLVGMGLYSATLIPEVTARHDLRRLCLHGNNLSSMAGLGHLTALRELVLSSNTLTSIDICLEKLKSLSLLDLTSNRLTSLDGLCGLSELHMLVSTHGP